MTTTRLRRTMSTTVSTTDRLDDSLGSILSLVLRTTGPGHRVEIREYLSGSRHVTVVPIGWRRFLPAFLRGAGGTQSRIYRAVTDLIPHSRVWTITVQ